MNNAGKTIFTILTMIILLIPAVHIVASVPEEDSEEREVLYLLAGKGEPLSPLRTRWGNMDITLIYDIVPVCENEADNRFWIVQFDGPITEKNKRDLSMEGFRIIEYLPEMSFVVDTEQRDPRDLIGIADVVSAGPFPSGMKMDPDIYQAFDNGGNIRDLVDEDWLTVDTFIPLDNMEEHLLRISPHVERGSSTRFLIGPTISSRDDLLGIDGISHIEPYYTMEIHNNVSKDIISVQETWEDLALDGTGQMVAISDTGLDTGVDSHSVDGDIHKDFDNRATIVNWAGTSPDDEHSHGTHVAGSVAGDGSMSNGSIRGMAPNASIFFQAIMTDTGSLSIPLNTSLLFQQAYDNGSRIHTNSWGSSVAGAYISRSQDVDWFLYNNPDMIILYSAGNSGYDWNQEDGRIDPDSIGAPATAKNAITVGATENNRTHGGYQIKWGDWGAWRYINGSWVVYPKYPKEPIFSDNVSDNPNGLAAFSSVGPTDDGRIKPDVVAPGTNILSCRSQVTGAGTGWGVFDQNYVYMGGTSMSTPITAGATALVREYYNGTLGMDAPSGALLKATLINGAMDLTPGQYGYLNSTVQEIQGRPDMHQGWGRINISDSLSPEGGNLAFMDNKEGIGTGDEVISYFNVFSSLRDLRITLAYSDYPGALYASRELVNDMDLVLVAPNGTRYNGNDWSFPFNDSNDRVNPVEGISISTPSTGVWKIILKGYNIPMGPQHFAVVASGDISNLSGAVTIDGEFFSTEGDEISITVTDQDVIGAGSITVDVTSDSDTAGIAVILPEIDGSGLFKGSVFTQNGSGSNSSRITVSHDDTIHVEYLDTDPYGYFNSTAIAKDPVRFHIKESPSLFLVQSENERIEIRGVIDSNVSVWWRLSGLSSGWRSLHDDGNSTYGDETAFDLNLSDIWYVPPDINGHFNLQTLVEDPYLGNRTYDHLVMKFNSSVPRYPKNVKVDVIPHGNSVSIRWDPSNETDLQTYRIYVNSSSSGIINHDGWNLISTTPSTENMSNITGLVDGTEYSFGVSVMNINANESSLSIPYYATPFDIIAPDVTMITTPRTIVGEINFEFTGSMDLTLVEMDFYNDSNGNKLMDDGDWQPIGEGPPSGVFWDTRAESGGPGDVDSMFIRYRGKDEVNNTSDWYVVLDFRVDNTGPEMVEIVSPPPRITNQTSHYLVGRGEAFGHVEVWINEVLVGVHDCNSLGAFDFLMNLTEGYNKVTLTAYDQYGAGPTVRNYSFSLDTMDPVAYIDVEDPEVITRDIVPSPLYFNSTSFDNGVDENYTYIDNFTWRVVDPLGRFSYHYGMESLPLSMTELGNYTIELTVRDPAKNSNRTLLVVEIVDTIQPHVTIDGSRFVNERETVSFSPNVTDNDPFWFRRSDNPIFWEFFGIDFHHNSTQTTALVLFPLPGVYRANLTIIDGGGNIANASLIITVIDTRAPEGNILGPTPVTLGVPATFTANVTDNDRDFPAGATYSWNLTFQGGIFEEYWSEYFYDETLTYNFTVDGSYMIILTVTDSSNNSRDISMVTYTIGDITPPRIIEVVPGENLTHQFSEDLKITLVFNEKINASSVDDSTIRFLDHRGNNVNITIERKRPEEFQIIPENLEFGRTYVLVVGASIKDTWGNLLEEGITVNYTIRTRFSLVFPEGVYPSEPDQNFTSDEDQVYSISIRFTNPVQISTIINGLTVISIKNEFINNEQREVRREVSFFRVKQGEDPYTAIINIELDMGTRYNITLDDNVRDIYDYRLDRMYQWEVKTFIPPDTDDPDAEEDGETDDIPDWIRDPTLLIIIAIIVLILVIIMLVGIKIRRKRKLDKMWNSSGLDVKKIDRKKPTVTITEEESSPSDDETDIEPPSYDDLYGDISSSGTDERAVEEESLIVSRSDIDWDEDEIDELDWDDEEMEEYLEEIEELDDEDDPVMDWD